jgi:hypothetical protein
MLRCCICSPLLPSGILLQPSFSSCGFFNDAAIFKITLSKYTAIGILLKRNNGETCHCLIDVLVWNLSAGSLEDQGKPQSVLPGFETHPSRILVKSSHPSLGYPTVYSAARLTSETRELLDNWNLSISVGHRPVVGFILSIPTTYQ